MGGLDTLTKIEKVKTDKDDKPTTEQVTRRWRHPRLLAAYPPPRLLAAHCVPTACSPCTGYIYMVMPCQVTLTGTNVLVNPFENLEAEMAEHHRLKTDPEAARAEEKARRCCE